MFPLGRIEYFLSPEIQAVLCGLAKQKLKADYSALHSLCLPPDEKKRKKIRNGSWPLSLVDAIGFFRLGRGGLTRDFLDALLTADKAHCDLEEYLTALIQRADERRTKHDKKATRRAKYERSEAQRFMPADAKGALAAVTGQTQQEPNSEEESEPEKKQQENEQSPKRQDVLTTPSHVQEAGEQHKGGEHEQHMQQVTEQGDVQKESEQQTGLDDEGITISDDTRADRDVDDAIECSPPSPSVERARRHPPAVIESPPLDDFSLGFAPSPNTSRRRDRGQQPLERTPKRPRLNILDDPQNMDAVNDLEGVEGGKDESAFAEITHVSFPSTPTRSPARAARPTQPASPWSRALQSLSDDSANAFAQPQSWVKADAIDFLLAVLVAPPYHVVNSSATLPTSHSQYRPFKHAEGTTLPPLVVPMSNNSHWVVAILKPDEHKATILDSMPSNATANFWDIKLRAFYKRLPDRSQTPLNIEFARDAARQNNKFSCGIYAVLNAMTRTNGLHLESIDDAIARHLLSSVLAARTGQPVPDADNLPATARCPVLKDPTPPLEAPAPLSGVARMTHQRDHYKRVGEIMENLLTQYQDALNAFKAGDKTRRYTCETIELALRLVDERLEEQWQSDKEVVAAFSKLEKLGAEEIVRLNQLGMRIAFDRKKLEQEGKKIHESRKIVRSAIKVASSTRANLAAEMDKAAL